jgi:hypothetical protein
VLSWDLILFLAADKWCSDNKAFQEDALIASCLFPLDIPLINPLDPEDIYDEVIY